MSENRCTCNRDYVNDDEHAPECGRNHPAPASGGEEIGEDEQRAIEWLMANPAGTMGATYHDAGKCWLLIDAFRLALRAALARAKEAESARDEAVKASRDWERSYRETLSAGNGLYATIVALMKPHFPADTRDLEWDVIPGTIGKVCRDRDEARAALDALRARLSEPPAEMQWACVRSCLQAIAKALESARAEGPSQRDGH